MLLNGSCLMAQDTLRTKEENELYNMTLEQLLAVHISVATGKELTLHESPGIVTLVTSDDIKNLGARDLTDVLQNIPGFNFGMDVEGVVGIGVRGNWAHEGKILLLIDGQEMNESLYSTLQFGNHYSLNNVDHIEIIRGPGSAVYGCFAEYAVVNIISKKPEDIDGIHIASGVGQFDNYAGHSGLSIAAGDEEKDFSYSFSAFFGSANRSNEKYTDVYGSSYDMSAQSAIRNSCVNLGLNVKDFKARMVIDNYNLFTRDAYQEILSKPYLLNFDSYLFELKKEIIINRKLTLTPKFNYKNQTPWSFDKVAEQNEFAPFKINSQRYSGNLYVNYDYNKQLNIICGTEYSSDLAIQKLNGLFLTNNSTQLNYQTVAAFAQTLFKTKMAILTAGARYNHNSWYEASFVPRLGITKVIKKAHFKILFSRAFRAPSTENMDLSPAIKPETTTVIEAEAGYALNDKMSFTINAYDILTKKPIGYQYNEMEMQDEYKNLNSMGTRGMEVQYNYKTEYGYFNMNYAFYAAKQSDMPESYAVPFNQDMALAFPSHKINVTAGAKITNHIKINTSVNIAGPRYGITGVSDLTGDTIIKRFAPITLLNTNINYDNFLVKGLDISFAVFNILNKKDYYIQPYNNLHAPMPANSREWVFKVSYDLNFRK